MQHMDELAEIAMTAHHQQGEHEKALEAARLIRSVPRQAAKLQTLGYWKELADLTQVTLTSPCPACIPPGLSTCCRSHCRLAAHRLEIQDGRVPVLLPFSLITVISTYC